MLVSVGSPGEKHVTDISLSDRHKSSTRARDNRPVVEHLQAKCLALRGSPQVRLKSIRVDDGNQRLNGV